MDADIGASLLVFFLGRDAEPDSKPFSDCRFVVTRSIAFSTHGQEGARMVTQRRDVWELNSLSRFRAAPADQVIVA